MDRRPRLLVIGLDGGTWDVARPLLDEGRLPNLGGILERGTGGVLRSTTPPLTPPAWGSFATGMLPGGHGLLDFFGHGGEDFLDRPPATYSDLRATTAWTYMRAAGLRVGLVHLPLTWPPDATLGFVVPGHGPRQGVRTHPPELHNELLEQVPAYDASATGRGIAGLVESMEAAQRRRDEVALRLASRRDWDVLMVMVKSTDAIAHATWRFRDPDHPRHEDRKDDLAGALDRAYDSADRLIGQLCELAPDANVVVASDHGHGPCHFTLGINRWLLDEGFLQLKLRYAAAARSRIFYALARSRHRSGWDLFRSMVDWSATLAYGGTGSEQGIYVNTVGREPEGIVEPGEDRDRLLTAIEDGIGQLVPPGSTEPLGSSLRRQEDHTLGPHAWEAPDLFFEGAGGRVILREGLRPGPIFRTSGRSSGTHRPDGLLAMAGPGIDSGTRLEDARIWDMAPTLLALVGLPVPAHLDGQVLSPVRPIPGAADPIPAPEARAVTISPAEDDRTRNELQGLGYLEM